MALFLKTYFFKLVSDVSGVELAKVSPKRATPLLMTDAPELSKLNLSRHSCGGIYV